MENFSSNEVDFIRKSLAAGVRADRRKYNEMRVQTALVNNLPFVDKSLTIKRGRTEAIINLTFKSSLETIKSVAPDIINYPTEAREKFISIFDKYENFSIFANEQSYDDLKELKKELSAANPIIEKIYGFLNAYKIGCSIECLLIKNDGNCCGVFYEGLRLIFESISVPDINDLTRDILTGIKLPICNTFAILDKICVADPTLIEEISLNCNLYVFDLDGSRSYLLDGEVSFSHLNQILDSFKNSLP